MTILSFKFFLKCEILKFVVQIYEKKNAENNNKNNFDFDI